MADEIKRHRGGLGFDFYVQIYRLLTHDRPFQRNLLDDCFLLKNIFILRLILYHKSCFLGYYYDLLCFIPIKTYLCLKVQLKLTYLIYICLYFKVTVNFLSVNTCLAIKIAFNTLGKPVYGIQ